MALSVHVQRAERDQLADDAAPECRGLVAAYSKGLQAVVAMAEYRFCRVAAENGGNVLGAEHLSGAIDG